MNAPVIHYHGQQAAAAAWRVHAALLKALRDAPELANDPRFVDLQRDAKLSFLDAFEAA